MISVAEASESPRNRSLSRPWGRTSKAPIWLLGLSQATTAPLSSPRISKQAFLPLPYRGGQVHWPVYSSGTVDCHCKRAWVPFFFYSVEDPNSEVQVQFFLTNVTRKQIHHFQCHTSQPKYHLCLCTGHENRKQQGKIKMTVHGNKLQISG